jgi:hypothetical protein
VELLDYREVLELPDVREALRAVAAIRGVRQPRVRGWVSADLLPPPTIDLTRQLASSRLPKFNHPCAIPVCSSTTWPCSRCEVGLRLWTAGDIRAWVGKWLGSQERETAA